ncbi:hypothetical protein LZC95_34740 [Pendulispora brunnea]|uniref:Uncharacterized protein n=1 Tax=Pendulispora brunnea TaxID=2905690 RepID=A0ABZ2JYN6_9BACT
MLIRNPYLAALTLAGVSAGSASTEITDIGTLDGNVCFARAINDAGSVVGQCRAASGHFEPTYWASDGTPEVIAPLDEGRSCDVVGIGDSDVAIGNCEFGDEAAVAAVRWTAPPHRPPQRLNPLEGHMYARATQINHAGTIAGASVADDDATHAVIWTTGAVTPTPLSEQVPSATSCTVTDMSDEEEPTVVGFCGLRRGGRIAVQWTKGENGYVVATLSSPADVPACEAVAINAKLQVAGTCETVHGDRLAVRWAPDGSLTVLHHVEGAENQQELWAEGMNEAGDIVGNYVTDDGLHHSFIWSPTGDPANERATDLGSLGGFWTTATGIANDGSIAGTAQNGQGVNEAFIWTPTMSMAGLGNLGGFTSTVTSISDSGAVAGTSQSITGQFHAFRVADGAPSGCLFKGHDAATTGPTRTDAKGANAHVAEHPQRSRPFPFGRGPFSFSTGNPPAGSDFCMRSKRRF